MPIPRQSLRSLQVGLRAPGLCRDQKGRNLSQKAMNAPITRTNEGPDSTSRYGQTVWHHTCLKAKVRRVSIL
jgi:hypothetical protein